MSIEHTETDYYVYVLRYPDNTVFYVGKGIGDRLYWHVKNWRTDTTNRRKSAIIADIVLNNLTVGETIFKDKLTADKAYDMERYLILHMRKTQLLTNFITRNTLPNPHMLNGYAWNERLHFRKMTLLCLERGYPYYSNHYSYHFICQR